MRVVWLYNYKKSMSKSLSKTAQPIATSQVSPTLCLEACAKGELTLVETYLKNGGDVLDLPKQDTPTFTMLLMICEFMLWTLWHNE